MTTKIINPEVMLSELEQRLATVKKEKVQIEKEKVQLEKKTMQLETEEGVLEDNIKPMRRLLELYTLGAGDEVTTISSGNNDPLVTSELFRSDNVMSDAYKGMSAVQAAKEYLTETGVPAPNRDLIDAIMSHGFETTSKDIYTSVRSMFYREMRDKGTFTFENGKWGLSKWKTGGEVANLADAENETNGEGIKDAPLLSTEPAFPKTPFVVFKINEGGNGVTFQDLWDSIENSTAKGQISRTYLHNILEKLGSSGRVIKEEGMYHLTQKGEQYRESITSEELEAVKSFL